MFVGSLQFPRAVALAALAMTAVDVPPADWVPEGMVQDFRYEKASGSWLLGLPAGERMRDGGLRPPTPTPAAPPEGGLPLLPDGRRIELLELGGEETGVGGRLWRGSGALCRWLASSPAQLQQATVLELGCGTGACGLYASALGARRVTLTDGGNDDLISLVRANVERNRALLPEGGAGVQVERFLFGEALPVKAVDLVLASDVTYSVNEARDALCRSLRELLLTGARCVISHEHRRSDMFDVEAVVQNEPSTHWDEKDVCLGTFLAAAGEQGLTVSQLTTEAGWREYCGEEVRMTTDVTVMEVHLAA